MPPIGDPSQLTPDELRLEVASILAAGLLRLRRQLARAGITSSAPKTLAESATTCLAIPDETVLSVRSG